MQTNRLNVSNRLFSARNRFNLRTTTASPAAIEEKNADENSIDTSPQPSSTQRSIRPRPSFNARGRSRGASTTSTAPPSDNEASANEHSEAPKAETEKPALKASSRFNLRRPNLLSPRGRPTKSAQPSTETPAAESHDDAEKNVSNASDVNSHSQSDESDQSNGDATTQAPSGLSRLRNRPRLQVQPRAPTVNNKPTGTAALNPSNRKVNPLLAKRKSGSSTTTEEPAAVADADDEQNDENAPAAASAAVENDSSSDDSAKEEQTEVPVVVSSEPPRGLGLISLLI